MRKISPLLVFLLSACLACGNSDAQDELLQSLWYEASTAAKGSFSAEAATRKIGTLDDERVHSLLVRLARGDVEFSNEHIQRVAIGALVERDEPGTGAAISKLLDPKESIIVRAAVARGLSRISCPQVCIGSIISYLRYVWEGGANIEDGAGQVLLDGGASKEFVEKVRASVDREQKEMYADLRAVLASNLATTKQVLHEKDSINNSSPPNGFAAELMSNLTLQRSEKEGDR